VPSWRHGPRTLSRRVRVLARRDCCRKAVGPARWAVFCGTQKQGRVGGCPPAISRRDLVPRFASRIAWRRRTALPHRSRRKIQNEADQRRPDRCRSAPRAKLIYFLYQYHDGFRDGWGFRLAPIREAELIKLGDHKAEPRVPRRAIPLERIAVIRKKLGREKDPHMRDVQSCGPGMWSHGPLTAEFPPVNKKDCVHYPS